MLQMSSRELGACSRFRFNYPKNLDAFKRQGYWTRMVHIIKSYSDWVFDDEVQWKLTQRSFLPFLGKSLENCYATIISFL